MFYIKAELSSSSFNRLGRRSSDAPLLTGSPLLSSFKPSLYFAGILEGLRFLDVIVVAVPGKVLAFPSGCSPKL